MKDSIDVSAVFFNSDLPLKCSLSFNIKKFQHEKSNPKYQPAELSFRTSDSLVLKKSVRLKPRGIYRRKYCSFPPFWINIQRVKNKVDSARVNQKIKVVSHCLNSSANEECLLKEYLVYKIYELLSDYCFHVRLIRFTYVDIARNKKSTEKWGFMIEPVEQLANRLEALPININTLGINYTDSITSDLLSLFAYMIGNTDWSISGRHNIKLFKHVDFNLSEIYPIPYDFDFTGFVNTSYAIPADGSGVSHVRERVYVGPCRELVGYERAAHYILSKKEAIYALINDFDYLKNSTKADLIRYLNSYFNSIQRKDFIKYHIHVDCIDNNE